MILCIGVFASINPIPLVTQKEIFSDYVILRREEIERQKEYWRPFIDNLFKARDPLFYKQVSKCLEEGLLIPIEEGLGGSYLLTCSKKKDTLLSNQKMKMFFV